MIQMIFTFAVTYCLFPLPPSWLIRWFSGKAFLKVTPIQLKIRLLILLISISVGYLTSSFFISIYNSVGNC